MRRVAVFGGSFNPFAKHHQDIVRHLVEHEGFSTVIVVPAAAHALKDDLIDYMHRFNMTKLGVDDLRYNGMPSLPHGSDVRVSMVEMDMLRRQPGPVRTYELLKEIRKGFLERDEDLEIRFAIGPDIPDEMDRWAHVDEIREEFGFVNVPVQSMRSTKLRQMIREGVEAWERHVPILVRKYIKMHGLYREAA
jgi:nicotinic acid mononucleotide adenylyltransferase